MRTLEKAVYLLVFLLIWEGASGQTVITGRLLDEGQEPISNVSVIYGKIGTSDVLGYTKTSENGSFRFEIHIVELDSLRLDFNHMGYSRRTVHIPNVSGNFSYILKDRVQKIQEITVGNPPIYRMKDTINYRVSAFTSNQDRVIADIIKKLPGIEMLGDQIYYQGKPIERYMVNNLDLMEGRYAMINQSLPSEAVKSVQVIENDQPIKMLDSAVPSDRVSLNLELKKFVTTGTAKIGTGYSPLLWDSNVTPMTFEKDFQMLNSFQANNIGVDAKSALDALYNNSSYFNQSGTTTGPRPEYVYLQQPASPAFDPKRWLDNRVFLVSSNGLKRLKGGLQVRGNVSYFNDLQKRSGATVTQFFADGQTIINSEEISNHSKTNDMEARLTVEANEKSKYLKNSMVYHRRWNADHGNILFNGTEDVLQRRNITDEAFLNSLTLGRFIGKQLFDISSVLEFNKTPQVLSVFPGQFNGILNQGDPYDELKQNIIYNNFRWNNSMGFSNRIKFWFITNYIGLDFKNSGFESSIDLASDGTISKGSRDFANEVKSSQLTISAGTKLNWSRNKWKLMAGIPFGLNYYNAEQHGEQVVKNIVRSTFNPSMGITYKHNMNSELSLTAGGGNHIGGLENFYSGYIVQMYRRMQRNEARLLNSTTFNTKVSYTFNNTLRANFANLSYEYSLGNRDHVLSSTIDSSGRTSVSISDLGSQNHNHRLRGGISKFFPLVKTVIKVNSSIGRNGSDYLVNNAMERQRASIYSGSIEVINNSLDIISGNYTMSWNKNINSYSSNLTNTIVQNNHFLNLTVHPLDLHTLKINSSIYTNNLPGQRNQFFMDAVYRFRIRKWKADLDLSVQNLFNNNNYIHQFVTEIQYIQSSFRIRPRQVMVSTNFIF